MASSTAPDADLIDLRFLPAWVKEEGRRYLDFEGEELHRRPPFDRQVREHPSARDQRRRDRPAGHRRDQHRGERRRQLPKHKKAAPLPQLQVQFLPHPTALENVAAQIKSGTMAYSLHALARLFLQKPTRYDVRIAAKEDDPFFRLGSTSIVATDRAGIEKTAFRTLKSDYYRVEVSLNEPVKGNFGGVARERSTGTLLGPTNYHAYQPQLRRLYEQRFSRRMSFLEFQRQQIEIVSDPALVEQWREEVRKLTTFTTLKEEQPQTFRSAAEAERHFREKYLPALIVETREAQMDGLSSRQLPDRGIARLIENAWSAEVRSPSHMMQELATRFRNSGLHIFRHRKGMLFVSPVRPRALDEAAASDAVKAITETVKASPRISRKELAEKLIGSAEGETPETKKLALAADLLWLVREGYVIEFNDGSLDLPRIRRDELLRQAGPDLVHGPAEARPSGAAVIPIGVEEPRDVTGSISQPDPSSRRCGGIGMTS